MTKAKKRMLIEIACELILRVQSDLCRGTRAEREIAADVSEIIRRLYILDEKIRKVKNEKQ